MTDANAFDPSSWADDDDGAEAPPIIDDDEFDALEHLKTLQAELVDLQELHRSTSAQLDKAQTIVESAKTELSRLQFRINTVEQDIESWDVDNAEDEG